MLKKDIKYLLLVICLVLVVILPGCPDEDKEEIMFGSMVTNFKKPPIISVYMNDTKRIKKMPLEEYLAGVVAGEMKPNWPLNAYAAQAILARTFTMEFLGRGGMKKMYGTNISTDEKEAQAYNAQAITPEIRKAVAKTKGQVMTYKGRYIRGWYSASCGGRSAYAKNSLDYQEKEPSYISSVRCPEEKYIPKSELFWQIKLTDANVRQALTPLKKDIGQVQKMAIVKKGPSGRAVRVKFTGTKGSAEITGPQLRMAIGPEKMRSTWITNIRNQRGVIIVKGRGFGHGVGLCQWGAYTLAKEKKSPEEIVKHYYPKTQIKKIW